MVNLKAACPIAFCATAGFAVFEAILDQLLAVVDPASLFAIRAVLTLPILLLVLRLRGRSFVLELRRLGSCQLHWVRGLAWSATAFLTVLAFWNTASLTETYALMLLHPLWTAVLARVATRERQEWRALGWPFALLLAGLALYGFGDGIDFRSPWSCVAPLAAGVAFALTNLIGVRIKRDSRHDALTKAVASSLVAILVAPLVLGLAPLLGGFELRVDPAVATGGDALRVSILLVAAAGIALLANIGITHAFDIARYPAVVAAMDSAIILLGLGLDSALSAAFDIRAYLGLPGIGILAMTAGTLWAVVKLESAVQRPAPAVRPSRPASGPAAGRAARRLIAGLTGNSFLIN